MHNVKYLIVIAVFAAMLLAFPAAKSAFAGGSFGLSFSYSVPYYSGYSYYPYNFGATYGWWNDHRHSHWGPPRHYRHGWSRPYYRDRHYNRHYGYRDHYGRGYRSGHDRGYGRW